MTRPTRDALRGLEGQLVWLTGRPTDTRRVNTERRDVCIASPKVWPWNGVGPVRQGRPFRAGDHAWIRLRPENPIRLLTPGSGLARVRWYSRRDGSVDLGFEIQDYLLIDELSNQVVQLYRDHDLRGVVSFCDSILESVGRGLPLISYTLSVKDSLRYVHNWRIESQRDLDAELRIRASSLACRGVKPTAPARFDRLLHGRRSARAGPARGFS